MDGRSTWKYPIYNTLAKVRYKLFEEAEKVSNQEKMAEYLDLTEAAIESAKTLVENSQSKANLTNKSIVYYNHSQILSALYPKDRGKQEKAKVSAEESIRMIESVLSDNPSDSSAKDLLQDYLYHSTFVLNSLGERETAKAHYERAVEQNCERFITKYTTDASAEELITFALTRDSHFVLKQINVKYEGAHNLPKSIDLNRIDNDGLSYLYKALKYNSKDSVIIELLHLGADPLLEVSTGSQGQKDAPLYEALAKGRVDAVIAMFDHLSDQGMVDHHRVKDAILMFQNDGDGDAAEALSSLATVLRSEFGFDLPAYSSEQGTDESFALGGVDGNNTEQ